MKQARANIPADRDRTKVKVDRAQDDELVMSLVELAMVRPKEERRAYLESACQADSDLFFQVWSYIEWEERMGRFLLDPIVPPLGLGLTEERPFKAGDVLEGRFRIVREVAHGGMGFVYEARDERLERRIAIKCAKAGYSRRLPPEVRTASQVSHPNICKIHEIHTASLASGDVEFLTMEYLEGETLAARLRRAPVEEKEARTIARQLAAGLAEAHRSRVIHGDLKSNNVILTRDADGNLRAVITDFGLARNPGAAMRTASSGETGGTPGYMAPELWKGEKGTEQSDIYALGVMLYEMVAGKKPHQPGLQKLAEGIADPGKAAASEGGVSPTATTRTMAADALAGTSWQDRLTRKPAPVSKKWDRVLDRCLDPNPAKRFRHAHELVTALEPTHTLRNALLAVAAVLVAAATGFVVYKQAAAPAQRVTLATLPLTADADLATVAAGLYQETSANIDRLTGSKTVALTLIEPNAVSSVDNAREKFSATHVLHGTLHRANGKVVLHAFLTDAQSKVNAKDWTAEYSPEQVHYIPVALAGFVTGTLDLPALAPGDAVNGVARRDYDSGVEDTRRDSSVDAAIEKLQQAVVADPDSPLTHGALAEAEWFKYYLTREPQWLEKAKESNRQAQLRNPDAPVVHLITGVFDCNSGLYERAAAEFRRVIELEPRSSEGHRRLGQAYDNNGEIEKALGEFQRAIALEPERYRNFQQLGAFYVKHSKYEDAIAAYGKAIAVAPSEPAPRYSYGVALDFVGRFEEAERELRASLAAQNSYATLKSLGFVLLEAGKWQDSLPVLVRTAEQGPKDYQAWEYLEMAYRHLGKEPERVDAAGKGLTLVQNEINLKAARNARMQASLAYFSARLGKTEAARNALAQALQLAPSDENVRRLAVMTYEALEDRKASLAVLQSAPAEMIAEFSRFADTPGLRQDPTFQQLLASHQTK